MFGHYIDERCGVIETICYRDPPAKKGKATAADPSCDVGNDDSIAAVGTVGPRPPVTKEGQRMIGDLRTDALHEALSNAEISDLTLLALFVLAGSGDNVAIRTGDTSIGLGYRAHDTIAAPVVWCAGGGP